MFIDLKDNEVFIIEVAKDYVTEVINTYGGTKEEIEDCIEQLEKMKVNEVLIAIDDSKEMKFITLGDSNGKFYVQLLEKERVCFQLKKIGQGNKVNFS